MSELVIETTGKIVTASGFALSGTDVFVLGDFYTIGGQGRNGIAKLSTANNGAADNISDKPKSVSVRFIRFVSYTEENAFFEFLRDEVALLVYYRTCRKGMNAHEFSNLPSSKGVTPARVALAELDKQSGWRGECWLLAFSAFDERSLRDTALDY